MGAVRAAAEARTKGVGLSSSTASGSAGRLHQMAAPLAETFSAGGRRWVGGWVVTLWAGSDQRWPFHAVRAHFVPAVRAHFWSWLRARTCSCLRAPRETCSF
jgi:hypothetical protein